MYFTTVFNLLYVLACICLTVASHRDAQQVVTQQSTSGELHEQSDTPRTPRIAVIGSGITGASSAHHLHQLARLHQPLDIVVFETEDRVGGRIRSAYVHNEPAFDVESGAASFTNDDWCLKEAMQEVGLKPARHSHSNYRTGVWDGHELIVDYDEKDAPFSSAWWQSSKWLWRYGSSLRQVQQISGERRDRFSTFALMQPFLRLSDRLKQIFSHQDISTSASAFFQDSKTNPKLVNEIIRAESRHRYARDLDQINALSSNLAIGPVEEVAIYQGNKRLPHRMLKISEAQTLLNTRASRIAPGQNRRWKICSQPASTIEAGTEAETKLKLTEAEFDIVILTAPFASNGIVFDLPPSVRSSPTNLESYVERHVSLFSTLSQLSSVYFNLPPNMTLPERILTAPRTRPATPSEDKKDDSKHGKDEIFSITVVNRVPPPDTFDDFDKLEFVYKIISSRPIPDEEIARLVGRQSNGDNTTQSLGISWIHRQIWPHAYPTFAPGEPILDNLEIAPDMYYTAAAGEVIDTMEVGCRMGLNLAKHLYYTKWLGDIYP